MLLKTEVQRNKKRSSTNILHSIRKASQIDTNSIRTEDINLEDSSLAVSMIVNVILIFLNFFINLIY